MIIGVGVFDGVNVLVGVAVAVGDDVEVGVLEGVYVEVGVAVLVGVQVGVKLSAKIVACTAVWARSFAALACAMTCAVPVWFAASSWRWPSTVRTFTCAFSVTACAVSVWKPASKLGVAARVTGSVRDAVTVFVVLGVNVKVGVLVRVGACAIADGVVSPGIEVVCPRDDNRMITTAISPTRMSAPRASKPDRLRDGAADIAIDGCSGVTPPAAGMVEVCRPLRLTALAATLLGIMPVNDSLNASARLGAVWKRSSGRFASAFWRTASMLSGMLGCTVRMGGGGSLRCIYIMLSGVSARKGTAPESIS